MTVPQCFNLAFLISHPEDENDEIEAESSTAQTPVPPVTYTCIGLKVDGGIGITRSIGLILEEIGTADRTRILCLWRAVQEVRNRAYPSLLDRWECKSYLSPVLLIRPLLGTGSTQNSCESTISTLIYAERIQLADGRS